MEVSTGIDIGDDDFTCGRLKAPGKTTAAKSINLLRIRI